MSDFTVQFRTAILQNITSFWQHKMIMIVQCIFRAQGNQILLKRNVKMHFKIVRVNDPFAKCEDKKKFPANIANTFLKKLKCLSFKYCIFQPLFYISFYFLWLFAIQLHTQLSMGKILMNTRGYNKQWNHESRTKFV